MRRGACAAVVVLLVGLSGAAAVGASGCSSSASPAASSRDSGVAPDTGVPGADASTDATTADAGAQDSAVPSDADAGAIDATPPGPVSLLGTIALAGTPTAAAFNPATNVLYVALADASGAGAGIAVIDASSNTLATTIASPGDGGTPASIVAMAVDVEANVLYAADSTPTAQTLYTIDGTTNAIESSLVLGVVRSIAVDSTTHDVYVLSRGAPFAPDGGANVIVPAAITVLGSPSESGPPTVVPGDVALSGSGLALDETNHRLYLCGPSALAFSNGDDTPAVVDTLDTTADLALVGIESTSGGAAVTCVAGWGGAAVVTAGPAGVDFVGGPAVALASSFAPAAAVGAGGAAAATVLVFGADTTSGALEVAAASNADGGSASVPPTSAGLGTGAWGTVVLAGASGGVFRVYATSGPADAGAAASLSYISVQTQ